MFSQTAVPHRTPSHALEGMPLSKLLMPLAVKKLIAWRSTSWRFKTEAVLPCCS